MSRKMSDPVELQSHLEQNLNASTLGIVLCRFMVLSSSKKYKKSKKYKTPIELRPRAIQHNAEDAPL